MQLYRPVGLLELELIAKSGFSEFPPRLPEQPIFYPVVEEEYAIEIAKDWNLEDKFSGYCGFVLQFDVDDDFVKKYPVQIAGKSRHKELWIPASELSDFNENILGYIRVMHSFYGELFTDDIDKESNLPKSISSCLE